MLGVDTNVLVRFLADDDDTQSPLARLLLSSPKNQPIYVGMVVFAETYTVLTRVKKFPEDQVRSAMGMLLSSSDFIVEGAALVEDALDHSAKANCGAVDALIGIANLAAHCEATATFDRRVQRLPTMIAVEDKI